MTDYQQQTQRRSLWETASSMPIINEATPLSARISSIQPQYSYDERKMLPYQQPKQAWPSDSLQSNSSIDVKQGPPQNFVAMFIVGTLGGLIVCGVPLAVMTTLYVQGEAANNTSGTSNTGLSAGTSSTYTVSLPSFCSSYTNISDATRNVGYSSSCCPCDSGLVAGWYRFVSPAGTQLATAPVGTGYCGTTYGAWFNGTLPTTVGGVSAGFACVYYSGSICYSSYSVEAIIATNCNGFYVYYLKPMITCNFRYCAT
ncbi:unnamed protein product [Rotaria sp. Silwood2]|nr:unnamed protein product [Rotaria sp. Silwood2]